MSAVRIEAESKTYQYTWNAWNAEFISGELLEMYHTVHLPNEVVYPDWLIKLTRTIKDGDVGLFVGPTDPLVSLAGGTCARTHLVGSSSTVTASVNVAVRTSSGSDTYWQISHKYVFPTDSCKSLYGWDKRLALSQLRANYMQPTGHLTIVVSITFDHVRKREADPLNYVRKCFQRDMDTFFTKEPDVHILLKNNSTIPVHSTVLAARSSLFRTMFFGASKMREKTDREVDLKADPVEHVQILVNYMYGRNTDYRAETWSDVYALFRLAFMYGLDGLCVLLVPEMVRMVSTTEHIRQLRALAAETSLTFASPISLMITDACDSPTFQMKHHRDLLKLVDELIAINKTPSAPAAVSSGAGDSKQEAQVVSSSSTTTAAATTTPASPKRPLDAPESPQSTKRAKPCPIT